MCVCVCLCVCVHHRANAKDARIRVRGGLRKKRGRALARAPRPPGPVVVLRVLRAARAGTPGARKRREAAAPVQALPARSPRARARARRKSEYLLFRVGDGRGFQHRRVGVAGMRATVGGVAAVPILGGKQSATWWPRSWLWTKHQSELVIVRRIHLC